VFFSNKMLINREVSSIYINCIVERPLTDSNESLELLRKKLWRARGRHSKAAGVALLIISVIFLILAYVTRYIMFEVTSIVALLLGAILVFTSIEPYVKMDVANRAAISSLAALSEILAYLKIEGKAAHIPPTRNQSKGRTFIPMQSESSLPTLEEITKDRVVIPGKGLLLPSTGSALLQLYERELGDLRKIDFDYLVEWLPRVLVDGLQMAEKMEITRNGEDIHAKLTSSAFRHLCQQAETSNLICETINCPMCSSIADAIAKNTNRIVYYKKCSYDPSSLETTAHFVLGPTLEKPRRRHIAAILRLLRKHLQTEGWPP